VPTAGAREELVPVAGGPLWTATSGAGAPLLLCHGGPAGYDDLADLAGLIADVAIVHRFDQRGGGRSTRAGPWTVAALVHDAETLRRRWGHEQWIVAGHSWGAHLALFFALAHSERTAGLVLLNGPGLRWGWGPERRARRLPRLTAEERREVEGLEASATAAARSRLRDLWWLTDFADRDVAERHPRPARYEPDPAAVAAFEAEWRRRLDGIEAELARLPMPALVLHGAADPMPEAGPRELAGLLPRGHFAVLPGAGHVPWLEDPGGVRAELRRFLVALRPRG
jgi:proline iminopeptidase